MKRNITSTVAGLLLFASVATTTTAGIIYDGGAPDQAGQLFAQGPGAAAMTFTLGPGLNTVTDAHWWGGCFPAITCGPSPDFELSFYTDNAGAVGTLIGSPIDVGTAHQTSTGNVIGPPIAPQWDEYSYSATFAPVTLTAGVQYWFAISNTAAEPAGAFGVETTSTAPAGALASITFDGTTWLPLPQQLSFNLTNDVVGIPEPATIALFGIGLAGLAASRRRKPGRGEHC